MFDTNNFLQKVVKCQLSDPFANKTISSGHRYAILSDVDKIALHVLSQMVPKHGLILEVGTFLGGGASVLAHANPNANVVCIDKFSDSEVEFFKNTSIKELRNNKIIEALGVHNSRTCKNVARLHDSFCNIKFIEGISPDDFADWDQHIDLYIEDSDHHSPGIDKNLEFWSRYVKKNGIIACHDYRPNMSDDCTYKFKDVITAVDSLAVNNQFTFLCNVGGFAILQKTG